MQAPQTPTGGMPGKAEFVVLMAALMASNALAIDIMLPALPPIGEALGVAAANDRQLVITFYLLGFGMAQLAYGPIADRFGRKPLLIGCMASYALFGALAGLAGSMELMLAARFLQGMAAAGSRVLVVAIVRDRFQGPAMAQIMSLVMIVFMIVPVLAPAFGQGMLEIGSWRYIFILLAIYGLLLAIWGGLRIPETLSKEARRPLSAANVKQAIGETLRTRASIGNSLTATLAFGALFAFIGSIQQIVFDVFARPELLGLVFGCIAGPMAVSSYANSRLVIRLGPRRLLLGALGAFLAAALLHLAVALAIGETIWTFVVMQALTMACFGLVGANAGALAMAPLGRIAGTASSVQGLITTTGAALIGFIIGQAFDGTTIPMITGIAVCGALALATAVWANRETAEAPEVRQG
jgi:DHA1 family bicyclomycin/chloramphenicol resistance-like MFS transporter